MPSDQALACKRVADNDCLKMCTIATDFKVLASEPGGDVSTNIFWGRNMICKVLEGATILEYSLF